MLTEEDPFTGPGRLPIPKFKGDKRLFESWYANELERFAELLDTLMVNLCDN